MENKCVVCDSGRIRTFIREEDLFNEREVLRCADCGLVFFRNESPDFDDTYWDKEKHREIYEEIQVSDGFREELKERIRVIGRTGKKGRLLDVGCGTGEFLDAAKRQGWQACGVEISKKVTDFAKGKYGLDIFCGTVEDCDFKDESFDLMTLWDVIEHIQHPYETLKAISRKLKKDGVVIIMTPDENSFFKDLAKFFYRISAGRVRFLLKYVYYLPHYFSYSPKTLGRLLEKHGLKIVRVEKDKTDIGSARVKIEHSYAAFKSRGFILSALPLVYFFMNIFGLHNKMVVYAKKV